MSRYDADDIYCYPNSSVLKNKLDLIEQDKLDAFEADITLARIISIENDPVNGIFDFDHLKRILDDNCLSIDNQTEMRHHNV
jgi:cell filamentation protein